MNVRIYNSFGLFSDRTDNFEDERNQADLQSKARIVWPAARLERSPVVNVFA